MSIDEGTRAEKWEWKTALPVAEVQAGDRVLLGMPHTGTNLYFDVGAAEHFEDGGYDDEPWIKLSGTWCDGAVCVRRYHGENRYREVDVLRNTELRTSEEA